MKKLLSIIFLLTLSVTILPAQMSKSKAMGNVYKNSGIHQYGFNFSESGKIGMSYLGATASFVGTAIYATNTFPQQMNASRTSQQNAVLIAGTTITGALVSYGTIKLFRRNHR